ncbi:DUF6531 domain-containing protein [Curtobacterium sp. MCPF17_052]|nr:DUF6531 domain-containing protein [Curtobacterium sp. MCPF17_052]WIB13974.1 DUF6531 domain-containing protein [Curtobacterium sp. MCPF17_052]
MDPVNTATGNFLESELDLGFTGASEQLRLTRMYNSLDDRVGVFGRGWASVLETGLAVDDEGATLTQADGRVLRFPRDGEGWHRAVGEYVRLTHEGDQLVVRDSDGGWWAFSPSGTWLAAGTGPGTTVRVERSADGTVSRLANERGRWIDVESLDGRIVVARGSDGRRVEYQYDDAGQLTHVHAPTGTRTYEWDDDGLVVAVVDEHGVVEARNTYDDRRRVVEQVTPHGRTVRFAYLPGRVTVVSDPDGSRSNTWIADAKGRLVGGRGHRRRPPVDALRRTRSPGLGHGPRRLGHRPRHRRPRPPDPDGHAVGCGHHLRVRRPGPRDHRRHRDRVRRDLRVHR